MTKKNQTIQQRHARTERRNLGVIGFKRVAWMSFHDGIYRGSGQPM
jgi:hypothetical protein